MSDLDVRIADVERFLQGRYPSVGDVELLAGGAWSRAFGFRAADRSLVIRFGTHVEDYEKDRMASGWARPFLPIPSVVEIGEAFDGVFAVSERGEGDKLDELPPARLGRAIDSLLDSLATLEAVDLPGTGYGGWRAQSGDASSTTWRDFLTSVPDRDDDRLRGWRERLSADAAAGYMFERAQRSLEASVHACSDLRRVVHGDLLAGNVLVSTDDRISAIFDWANALAGDPLYDYAWLLFWAPWHPGIDPKTIRDAAVGRFGESGLDERLFCYQLNIALDSIQYKAFAGLLDDLNDTVKHTGRLLDGL
ncbi:MAG: aminoglycoside phosphotransferase family protein [Actinomycetota bacterium]